MKTILFAIVLMIPWVSSALGQTPDYERSVTSHWRNATTSIVIDVWDWPESQGGRLLDGDFYAKFYASMFLSPTFGNLVPGVPENIQQTVHPSLGRGDERIYKVVYFWLNQLPPPSVDTLWVTISNYSGGEELLKITLTLTNSPPITGNVTLANPVAWRSGPVAVPIISAGSDPHGDPLYFSRTIDTQPSGCGTITWDGVFRVAYFTPTNGVLGLCTIQYKVRDRFAESLNTGTLTVQVINTAPVAGNLVVSANAGTPMQIDVLANASDPEGDPLAFVSNTVPAPEGCGDAFWDPVNRQFDFLSNVFGATCQWSYTLTDSIASSTGTVTVNVLPELVYSNGFE